MTERAELLLAPLVAAAAAGRRETLGSAAREALAGGVPGGEIREALLTLVPFCGIPRTLDALAEVRTLVGEIVPEDPEAPVLPRGVALFERVYGTDAAKVRANLADVDPEVLSWIERDAYGRILARPGITASLRERIAVVLLATQGLRQQLPGHLRGALRCGASPDEIRAFLDAAAAHVPPRELAFARETLSRVAR